MHNKIKTIFQKAAPSLCPLIYQYQKLGIAIKPSNELYLLAKDLERNDEQLSYEELENLGFGKTARVLRKEYRWTCRKIRKIMRKTIKTKAKSIKRWYNHAEN